MRGGTRRTNPLPPRLRAGPPPGRPSAAAFPRHAHSASRAMPPPSSWAPGRRPGRARARYQADRTSGSRRAWSARAPSARPGPSPRGRQSPPRRAERGGSAIRRRPQRGPGQAARGGEGELACWVRALRPMRLRRSVRLHVLLHDRVELRLRLVANQLLRDLAVLEEEQPGNGDDPVLLRDVLLGVDVELPHLQLALVLLGQLIDGRR